MCFCCRCIRRLWLDKKGRVVMAEGPRYNASEIAYAGAAACRDDEPGSPAMVVVIVRAVDGSSHFISAAKTHAERTNDIDAHECAMTALRKTLEAMERRNG